LVGIKTIGTGDLKQLKAKRFGLDNNPRGLINSLELKMNIRASNIHKKDNQEVLTATIRYL